MKIFLVNLDRRPDRLAHARNEFGRFDLDFVRFSAVDGSRPEVREAAEGLGTSSYGARISAGAYACFQSHRSIWKQFLDSGDSSCVICEDDILLGSDFRRTIEFDWSALDFDVVKLETFRTRVHLGKATRIGSTGRSVRQLHSSHVGTGGYILSRRGAERALHLSTTCREPVDEFLFKPDSQFFRASKVLQLFPAVVIQGDRLASGDPSADWRATSIKDRFMDAAAGVSARRETGPQRVLRRLVNEVRAAYSGTRYLLVPFR